MSMHTRCTHCEAVFRVTLLQLQSSSGRVRCGVCHDVFDAFVNLRAADPPPSPALDAPDSPQSVPLPEAMDQVAEVDTPATSSVLPDPLDIVPAPDPDLVDRVSASDPVDVPVSVVSTGHPEPDVEGLAPDTIAALERAADVHDIAEEAWEAPSHEGWPPDESELIDAAPGDRMTDEADAAPAYPPQPAVVAPSTRRPRWPLAVATSAALVVLAVQAVHQFRTQIATAFPVLRPPLEAACGLVGCGVPLPRLPDRLVIEASDLGALDPTRPNRVVLATTVRNAAPVAQAYPMLELTLTDARDQVTARKVFEPQEYLDTPPRPGAGIGPEAEFSVRVQLDVGDIEASGYRIYLFHR